MLVKHRIWTMMALLWLCALPFEHAYSCIRDGNGAQPKVVFMGNSITAGWEIHYPELFGTGYWINCGIGGQMTLQMLERFERDVLATNPDVVVLMGGTNDIAGLGGPTNVDSIFTNIARMVAATLERRVAVVLCSVLPAHEYGCCPDARPIPMIAALNAKLRRFAEQKGLVYVDYYSLLVDERKGIRNDWTDDGVHPNKAGYAKMLPITIASILEAYGKHTKENR